MMEATVPNVDELSHRIAARGRVALVERLRKAYRDAASAHADIVSLEEDRLEALVQNAADHADGLQWRRALAGLVADELGVTVAEALSHPAVIRAQSILGAPSYEQSLAELITRPIPPPLPPRRYEEQDPDGPPTPIAGQMQLQDERGSQLEELPSEELEATVADDTVVELLPSPDPAFEVEQPTEAYEIPVEELQEESAGEAQGAAPEPELVAPVAAPEPVTAAPTTPEPVAVTPAPASVAQAPASVAQAPASVAPAPVAAVPEVDSALPAINGTSVVSAPEPEPEPEREPDAVIAGGDLNGNAAQASSDTDDGVAELRVPAIHLGGVANLPTGSDGLDLRLSGLGLDIMRGEDTIIGRLPWPEIEALEVPAQRRRRRSGAVGARLVVRTQQGDASFEIPGFSSEELRDRVELRIDRYRQL